MIAGFFKQSKPIVYLILGIFLTALYVLEIFGFLNSLSAWYDFWVILLKYFLLLSCFILFNYFIRHYEIQKGNSYAAFLFVVFSSFYMSEILESNIIFSFILLTLGLIRLLNIVNTEEKTLSIFEATFLIFFASLFYEPIIYFLGLIFVASLLFIKPYWRHYISPILAISAVVILVQMFYLISENQVVGVFYFLPPLSLNVPDFNSTFSIYSFVIWILVMLLSIYQIFKVKQLRALYHKQMASFFLSMVLISVVSVWLSESDLLNLWWLSSWPLGIYIAKFLSRLQAKKKREVMFWGFISLTILNSIL